MNQEPRKLPLRITVMLALLALISYAHAAASAVSIAAGCMYERPLMGIAGAVLGLSALGGAAAHQRLLAQAQAVFEVRDQVAARRARSTPDQSN